MQHLVLQLWCEFLNGYAKCQEVNASQRLFIDRKFLVPRLGGRRGEAAKSEKQKVKSIMQRRRYHKSKYKRPVKRLRSFHLVFNRGLCLALLYIVFYIRMMLRKSNDVTSNSSLLSVIVNKISLKSSSLATPICLSSNASTISPQSFSLYRICCCCEFGLN